MGYTSVYSNTYYFIVYTLKRVYFRSKEMCINVIIAVEIKLHTNLNAMYSSCVNKIFLITETILKTSTYLVGLPKPMLSS